MAAHRHLLLLLLLSPLAADCCCHCRLRQLQALLVLLVLLAWVLGPPYAGALLWADNKNKLGVVTSANT
jgi:hypothetical protein